MKTNKKIIITENQLNRLRNIVKEQFGEEKNGKYRMIVDVDTTYHNLNYKGYEINYIDCDKITISFDIDIEYRSYGIKSIYISSISGPSYIYANVSYYIDDDNEQEESVILHLDWTKAQTEDSAQIGWIGIDSPIEIELANDKSGNLFAKGISINIRTV